MAGHSNNLCMLLSPARLQSSQLSDSVCFMVFRKLLNRILRPCQKSSSSEVPKRVSARFKSGNNPLVKVETPLESSGEMMGSLSTKKCISVLMILLSHLVVWYNFIPCVVYDRSESDNFRRSTDRWDDEAVFSAR